MRIAPTARSEVAGSHVLTGGWTATEHRRSWTGQGWRLGGQPRIHSGGRSIAHQRRRAFGRWAIATAKARSLTRLITISRLSAANLLDNDPRRVSDRILTYALYIDPPLGRAGMTEAEVRQTGRSALVGKRPMTKVGRAVEKGESQGFMKIVVDEKTKEILGAAILGVGGDEAVHCILDVMYAKAPYTTIQRAVHIHPTVCELIPTMLGDLKPLVS